MKDEIIIKLLMYYKNGQLSAPELVERLEQAVSITEKSNIQAN